MMKSLNLLAPLISFFSVIYVIFYTSHEGYTFLFLLPLIYSLIHIFFFRHILFNKETSIFAYASCFILFVRYVLYPLLLVMSSNYSGRGIIQPQVSSYHLAIMLMVYELIICSIFLYYKEVKFQRKYIVSYNDRIKLCNFKININFNKYAIVYIFILLSFFYLFLDRSWLSSFYFMDYDNIDFGLTFSSIVFLTFKNILFVIFLIFLINKYNLIAINKRGGYKYIVLFLIMLLCLFNSAITFGLNRMRIVMTILASVFTISLYMKPIRKKTLIFLLFPFVICFFIILNSVTSARGYADMSDHSQPYKYSSNIQVYLGGVHNVALATEMKDYFPESGTFKELIFDCTRPIIGLNLLLKESDAKFTNEYFNKRIFLSDHMSQILPMIGHGYHFFGFIFSPLFSLLFIALAYVLQYKLYKSRNPFYTYFFVLVVLRFSLFPGQNVGNFASFISIYLFPILFIFLINNLLRSDEKNLYLIKI